MSQGTPIAIDAFAPARARILADRRRHEAARYRARVAQTKLGVYWTWVKAYAKAADCPLYRARHVYTNLRANAKPWQDKLTREKALKALASAKRAVEMGYV